MILVTLSILSIVEIDLLKNYVGILDALWQQIILRIITRRYPNLLRIIIIIIINSSSSSSSSNFEP